MRKCFPAAAIPTRPAMQLGGSARQLEQAQSAAAGAHEPDPAGDSMSDDDEEEEKEDRGSGSMPSGAAGRGDGAAATSNAASALRHLTVRHTLHTVVRRRWKAQPSSWY